MVFGFVSAQSQGFSNLLLRQSLAKKPKILAPKGYSVFSNAPVAELLAIVSSANLFRACFGCLVGTLLAANGKMRRL